MGIIGEGVDPAQAAADRRLAWTIVGIGAAMVVLLAVVGIVFGLDHARRATVDGGVRDDVERTPLPSVPPPPPDTAEPVGDVADWIGPDDYPPAARRAGEEGSVRVTLAIGPDGKPTGCSVAERNASWSLENGTCLVLMRKGRFAPARRGEPGSRPGEVRRWTSPPIRWTLPV